MLWKKLLFITAFCILLRRGEAGSNGGLTCAVCTYLVGMAEQLSQVHSDSMENVLDKYVCDNLPEAPLRMACHSLVFELAPYLVDEVYKHESPDTVCHQVKLCAQESQYCHLFPLPSSPNSDKLKFHPRAAAAAVASRDSAAARAASRVARSVVGMSKRVGDGSLCKLPGVDKLCDLLDRFKNGHLPIQDGDGDNFSSYEKGLRGYYWRGRDCDDENRTVHPGRKPQGGDVVKDSNCNGIYGSDITTGESFENLFCNGTQQLGVIALGDSASAHFHIPPAYLEAEKLSKDTFKDLTLILENEFDWPQLSGLTAFMDNKWPSLIQGRVSSVYLTLLERNRCNHRDYQNIAVNGAKSSSIRDVVKGISRNQTSDHPAFVNMALIGNDVCNGNSKDTVADMTNVDDYRKYMLETLNYLDSILPNGSIVAVSGLADGRILWDTMNNRIHPVGQLNGDIKYKNVYAWLNCLELSPCVGWMNSNETIRNMTSQRALDLSKVAENITKTETFKHFRTLYYDYDIKELMKRWEEMGGFSWQLIDPVDGFHPNQNAQALLSEYVMEKLVAVYPKVFKAINPNNAKIQKVFGNQNGY